MYIVSLKHCNIHPKFINNKFIVDFIVYYFGFLSSTIIFWEVFQAYHLITYSIVTFHFLYNNNNWWRQSKHSHSWPLLFFNKILHHFFFNHFPEWINMLRLNELSLMSFLSVPQTQSSVKIANNFKYTPNSAYYRRQNDLLKCEWEFAQYCVSPICESTDSPYFDHIFTPAIVIKC